VGRCAESESCFGIGPDTTTSSVFLAWILISGNVPRSFISLNWHLRRVLEFLSVPRPGSLYSEKSEKRNSRHLTPGKLGYPGDVHLPQQKVANLYCRFPAVLYPWGKTPHTAAQLDPCSLSANKSVIRNPAEASERGLARPHSGPGMTTGHLHLSFWCCESVLGAEGLNP